MKYILLLENFGKKEDPSPDFVPFGEFQNYRWLSNPSGEWYYKYKREDPIQVPSNPFFIESVDESLKEVVSFLIEKQIPTTPSCSGHFGVNDNEFRKVYSSLLSDLNSIRGKGIVLKDEENGEEIEFQNRDFELPWDEETFVQLAKSDSSKGVIGVFDPESILFKNLSKERILNTQTIRDGNLTIFLTSANNGRENNEIWRNYSNVVNRSF